ETWTGLRLESLLPEFSSLPDYPPEADRVNPPGNQQEENNMKPRNLILTSISIICVGVAPKAHAISPPPDGGYPGGNTAEGANALLSLTTGTYNNAIGIYSLLSLTDGSFCTGVCAGPLLANTAAENTAIG